MKIQTKSELCVGHGRCYSLADAVYAPDDEGFCDNADVVRDIDASLSEPALLGAKSCPEGAIEIIEK